MFHTPKPSNWLLVAAMILAVPMIVCPFWVSCAPAANQQQAQLATQTCAQALASVPQVQAQATKLGIDPLELARRTCDTAVLAAQLLEANLAKDLPSPAATTSCPKAPVLTVGAAGSGG